jgi:hypothetical protein
LSGRHGQRIAVENAESVLRSRLSSRYSAPNATPRPFLAVGSVAPYLPRSLETDAVTTRCVVSPRWKPGVCK